MPSAQFSFATMRVRAPGVESLRCRQSSKRVQLPRVTRAEHRNQNGFDDVSEFHVARRAILATGSILLTAGFQPVRPLPIASPAVRGNSNAAQAATVLGKPVTDPRLILRDSLPSSVTVSQALLDLDQSLRSIGGLSASRRSAAGSRSIAQSSTMADAKLSQVDQGALLSSLRVASNAIKRDAILGSIPASNRTAASALLDELSERMSQWESQAGASSSSTPATTDPAIISSLKSDMLNISGQLQSLLVTDVPVPAEYASMPQLRGRAVAEIKIKDADRPGKAFVMSAVLDGVNAPITSGNFVDLVRKGFYNNMPIQRADGFVVQTGERKGGGESGGPTRNIPMEVRYEGEAEATYGYTKEELGLMRKQVVLPFNALGTLAMARKDIDANSADTQFFFLNKESEVTPSGANVLDGNYAVFGYVVGNPEVLNDLHVGDVIESVRITYGADRFVEGSA
eukprot:CAMPEP_0177771402 /NCGR_PEP_ID=MMETSP0491_2-20121128/11561_1 /TAXON_ID=63592 /ORGANISM="Tetraselmis chuii, Strain PLY429" /LENGTH=455 /DNA_ID=CAMNT_0019288925 /DNA_START=172 /DNA_END=1539 /DNA_ORIENTATION=-